jgi:hypothetical protein
MAVRALVGLNNFGMLIIRRSDFTVNDNAEWLQMIRQDIYSSYHLGRLGAEMLEWMELAKRAIDLVLVWDFFDRC